jgi:hypothetical protein
MLKMCDIEIDGHESTYCFEEYANPSTGRKRFVEDGLQATEWAALDGHSIVSLERGP